MAANDPRPEPRRRAVFLNFPYDQQFVPLYLAYIAGVCSFGLVPRAALDLPGGRRRLDRIVELILACPYSFHDLSRVELDLRRTRTPRMNMAFELGLTVMASYLNRSGIHSAEIRRPRYHVKSSLIVPMRKPIVITGPDPTLDEVAEMLGLSARRRKELDRMMEEYFRKEGRRGRKPSTPAKRRDGRKRSAS